MTRQLIYEVQESNKATLGDIAAAVEAAQCAGIGAGALMLEYDRLQVSYFVEECRLFPLYPQTMSVEWQRFAEEHTTLTRLRAPISNAQHETLQSLQQQLLRQHATVQQICRQQIEMAQAQVHFS